jgi:hypothetical protein
MAPKVAGRSCACKWPLPILCTGGRLEVGLGGVPVLRISVSQYVPSIAGLHGSALAVVANPNIMIAERTAPSGLPRLQLIVANSIPRNASRLRHGATPAIAMVVLVAGATGMLIYFVRQQRRQIADQV